MPRSRRRHAANDETQQQEQLVDEGRDTLNSPATLNKNSEASDGTLENWRRVLVLLAEDVGEGEEDVVGQLAVQTGSLGT